MNVDVTPRRVFAICLVLGATVTAAGLLLDGQVAGDDGQGLVSFETVTCEQLRVRHVGGLPILEDANWTVDHEDRHPRMTQVSMTWPMDEGDVVHLGSVGRFVDVSEPRVRYDTNCEP